MYVIAYSAHTLLFNRFLEEFDRTVGVGESVVTRVTSFLFLCSVLLIIGLILFECWEYAKNFLYFPTVCYSQ